MTLLEAHRDFDRDFRGDTIHPSTLEVLDQIGLAERLHQLPHVKAPAFRTVTPTGTVTGLAFSRLPTPFPYMMIMPQSRFLEFLAEEARQYPHFELVMGADVRRVARFAEPVRAAIESMNGARFVHDRLELHGWEVEIADAVRVKGLAPLACKTDRIDAWVLAELSRRELVPAIWLPDPRVRAERERARWRLHLVRHRSSLKQRVHAVLLAHGKPCPVSDLFGVRGRQLLSRLDLPEPWAGSVEASLRLIDELDREIAAGEAELRRLGAHHRYVPLLLSAPGIGWVLAYTIAAEIGDIARFASPTKLAGYTGLCPRVYQSGQSDRRGPLAKQGPKYLRWALVEAATHASTHPLYRERYQRTKARLGKQRGARVAQVDLARRLAGAIWHMLTRNRPFAPAGATNPLAA